MNSLNPNVEVQTPKGNGTVTAAPSKGWVEVELESGETAKFRAKELTVVEAAAEGTRIRPKWDELTKVRAASGKRSFDNADEIALQLRGKTLDEAYEIVSGILAENGEPESVDSLKERYQHLNPGHQRMCIGNKARAAIQRRADGVVQAS